MPEAVVACPGQNHFAFSFLGLEVAYRERSTDDQSDLPFFSLPLLTKDLPEAGLKC